MQIKSLEYSLSKHKKHRITRLPPIKLADTTKYKPMISEQSTL